MNFRIVNMLAYASMLILFTECRQEQTISKDVPVPFPTFTVMTMDTVLFHEYVADVFAQRNVDIRSREQGYLDQIYVDEGQTVKAGQVMFKINDEEYKAEEEKTRAAMNRALADAKVAEWETERVALLVEKNVVSQAELRLARAKVEVALAQVAEARAAFTQASIRLSHTIIRAPFDGVVDRIPFKIGSLIDKGQLLTSLFSSEVVYAYFRVSEKEYLEYVRSHPDDRNSDSVEFILADGTHHSHRGFIETLEGEFDTSTGTIAFRARFPNEHNVLRHGSSGKVRLSNTIESALLVPQKATFEIQDKTFVFKVDQNNVVRMTSFLPGARLSHFYIVESGLKRGDRVIYEGIKNVRDGMHIQPTDVLPDSVLARAVVPFKTML